jgi:hypothetical protein
MKKLKNIKSMKTLYKTLKIAAGIFLVAVLAVSCVPEQQSMGDAGQTLVKLATPTADGFNLIVLDPISTPQSFLLFDVRKNSTNSADLNTETVVTFQYDNTDTAMLKAYNAANGTDYVPMGAALYTLAPAMVSGKFTFTFAPGDLAKTVTLTIPNAFNLDMGLKYAFIYKVTVTSGTGMWSETSNDTLITQILPKNKYDGVYTVTALSPMVDLANGALTGYYPFTYALVTTGANTCDCIEVEDDYPLHPISNGGAWSYYGSFCPQLEFNPDGSGQITAVTNYWGQPAGNSRSAEIDPSGVNAWDPATGDITIKYFMKQPTVVTTPPYIRTKFDELWSYTGSR